jgi:serine/threonine protein kinase
MSLSGKLPSLRAGLGATVVDDEPQAGRRSGLDLWKTLDAIQRGEITATALSQSSTPGEPGAAEAALAVVGRYRIVAPLGSGAMGMVFKAQDADLDRRVALKVMHPVMAANPNARQRFLREARAMAAVRHDNVALIYDVGQEGEMPYLAMEYLRGDTLNNLFELGCKPLLPQLLRIGREVATGLAAAHKMGLIHRDIKPSNIWIESPSCRVKILDFGLARAADGTNQLTQAGQVVGTPGYVSPEQASGGELDARSDLFSLGCVLYSLCTGKRPFKGETMMTALSSLAVETPAPIRQLNPTIPGPLADLVTSMLEKSPDLRPESAARVAETFAQLEQTLIPRPRPKTAPTPGAATPAAAAAAPAASRQPRPFPVHRVLVDAGDYVIEVREGEISVLARADCIILHDHRTDRKYQVSPRVAGAEVKLEVLDLSSGLQFDTTNLVLRQGERVACDVRFEPR